MCSASSIKSLQRDSSPFTAQGIFRNGIRRNCGTTGGREAGFVNNAVNEISWTGYFQSIHKKYQAGNKYHISPLDKAQKTLKNHRKKHKSAKYGFDQKDRQVRVTSFV